MKRNALIVLFISAALFMVGLVFVRKGAQNNQPALTVVASFYPLAHFAEQVGGENVRVYNLTPAGAEPHDYEPTPQDLIRIQKANVLLLNGAGIETWASAMPRTNADVVIMSEHVPVLFTGAGAPDPHIWLDPVRAVAVVQEIEQVLSKNDPDNKNVYEQNAANYIEELKKLDSEFATSLSKCQTRFIVVSHDAFGYLAYRYGINTLNISGLSPESEPSAKRLAELSVLAKNYNVKAIFFETLVSARLAETVAREAKVTARALDPLEGLSGADVSAGKTYLSVMRENLNELKNAMTCQ